MAKPTSQEVIETVHPGLLARLATYGGTLIEPDRGVCVEVGYDASGDLIKAAIGVRMELPDKAVIQIRTRNNKAGGIWRNGGFFSYHYGPSRYAMDEVFFRIDLAKDVGLHCHIRGEGPPGSKKGGHVDGRKVDPDVHGMDPLRFLDLVDKCRREGGKPPLRKVGP